LATRGKDAAKHARHLVEPPEEFLEQKLALFDTPVREFNELPAVLICALDKAVEITPQAAKPKIIDVVSHTRKLNPGSLDELKELAGVPNRAFTEAPERGPLAPERAPVLHTLERRSLTRLPERITLSRLRAEDKATFWQASHNILRGPADERMLERSGYKQIADAMLRVAKNIPAFLARNLIVCDGDVVTFSGYGALYFNNVLVYGSGRIQLANNTTLHAYQVKHV